MGNRCVEKMGVSRLVIMLVSSELLVGCSSIRKASIATDRPFAEYEELYGVYPGVAGNGVTKHLVRSHTTAILVRPVSSTFELGSRLWDQVWDWERRLDVRFIRFPLLNQDEIPELAVGSDGMDLAEWEQYLDDLTGRPSYKANVEFLIDGDAFYTELESAIDGAVDCIYLQTYLFDNDDIARAIADRLRVRSGEVDVRIICDGLGTYLSHLAKAESQPEDYVPIDNIPRYLCRGSKIRLRIIPNTWMGGNHVKCIVIDRRMAFVGGMNIGREYRHEWHDMMVRIQGDAVNRLSQDFQHTWRYSGWGGDFATLAPDSYEPVTSHVQNEVPVRFLRTQPARAQIYHAQVEAIRRARAYIYIENCYMADDQILYELCRARKRGVDVRVIFPGVVNHTIMEHSNRIVINTLLENGAKVYVYPRMSHVKAAVYDGWACFGTANLDKLSLQVIRELNMATSDPETVQALLDALFIPDFEQSVEVVEPVPLELQDHLIELVADEV